MTARRSREFGVLASLLVLSALATSCAGGPSEPSEVASGAGAGGLGGSAPTFHGDVAPILSAHCTPCHRAAGPAPFALTDYAEVTERARRIVEVTASRYMPLWLPEPGGAELTGVRRLSERQIEVFRLWAAGGAAEGERPESPAPPGEREAPPGVADDGAAWDAVASGPSTALRLGGDRATRTEDRRFVCEDRLVLEATVRALAVRPRASPSTRELSLRAVLPAGHEIQLLRMAWLKGWQEDYVFRRPMPLPAGTHLFLRSVADAVPPVGEVACSAELLVVADNASVRAALARPGGGRPLGSRPLSTRGAGGTSSASR